MVVVLIEINSPFFPIESTTKRIMQNFESPDADFISLLGDGVLQTVSMSSTGLSGVLHRVIENEDNFIKKLCQSKTNTDSISASNFTKTVESIYEAHSTLRDNLQSSSSVSCAFSGFLPSLTLYLDYCCYLKRMRSTLQKTFDLNSQSELYFEELLLAPLHHLTRYEVILTHLCKALPEQEGKVLNVICETLQRTVFEMKNICTATQNALKILWIQKCFVNGQPKIFVPGRIFLREGTLMKVSHSIFSNQERILFLFNDILIICKSKKRHNGIYRPSSLHCCSVIPLQNCSVRSVLTSKAEGELVFKVSWESNSYFLFSKTPGLSQSWAKEIQMAIRSYKDFVSLVHGDDRNARTRTLRRTDAMVRRTAMPKVNSESNVKQCLISGHEDSFTVPQNNRLNFFQSLKFVFGISMHH